MKYLILIYSNPVTWAHPTFLHRAEVSSTQHEELTGQFNALIDEITESGELVTAEPLADPSTTTTVRVRDGVTVPTDGPFLEAKEHLAGYFVVDCETKERATELAGRFPDARFSAVEVRPIMDLSGMEM